MSNVKYILRLFLLVLCLFGITACNTVQTQGSKVASTPLLTLRSLAQARHFFLGTAVSMNALGHDKQYASVLGREFNMVTPENVMKFDATNPQPGVFTFAQADALVAFARAHGMQVRGHNLIWHRALPHWVTQGTFSRTQLLAIMKEHITTVVAHYRGQVNIWDVVNEAIDENGALRSTLWKNVIGPEYIDLAFRWAHEANPQAHLFYNDYAAEGLGVKADAVYQLVKGMVQRGVPIYGVGLQMHTSIVSPPVVADVRANMQRLAALGLKVEITEMDVQIQKDPRPLAQRLQAQAQLYHDVLALCLSLAPCEAFVMWGFTDRYTWIPSATGNADEPLIFDDRYQPKPAYKALLQALLNTKKSGG